MSVVILGAPGPVVLYDANGVAMAVEDGVAIPVGTQAILLAGSDGTNARIAKVTAAGRVVTDGSEVTQPVSAASLPLPAGASTSANQTTGNSSLASILAQLDVATSTRASQTTVASIETILTAIRDTAGVKKITDQLPTGTNTIGKTDQGLANTAANRWPVYPTDGTNNMPMGDAIARAIYHLITDGTTGPVAVKAASTPPVAADKALVTVISPNQQAIPVTNSPAGSTPGLAVGEMTTTAVTDVAIRKTTYTEPSSNAQRSVASSNANDTSAGTGARTIRLTYYTATFTGPFTEDITMNGTSNVNTVATNICYIEKIEVLTVGSTGSNVGIISLFGATAGGGGTVGTIAATDNRTLWTHHYVATGKVCSITGLTGNNSNSSNNTRLSIRSKNLSVAASPDLPISDTLVNGGGLAQTQRTYATPLIVTGPARVTAFGAPAGTPSIVTRASFDFFDQ